MARVEYATWRISAHCSRSVGKSADGQSLLHCPFELRSVEGLSDVLAKSKRHVEKCGGPVTVFQSQYIYVWPGAEKETAEG